MDEQLKPVRCVEHGRTTQTTQCGLSKKKATRAMLPYNVDKLGSVYAQARWFSGKREGEKILHFVSLNYILVEHKNLLVVMISKHDKKTANQSVCKVL